MKCKMTKTAAALALTLTAMGSQAAVVGPTNMQVTGGAYGLGAFTGGTVPSLTSSYWNGLFGLSDVTDQYNPAGWDLSVPQTIGSLAPGASISLMYGTGPTDQMNIFFAPNAVGASGGGAAPVFNGQLVDGNISSIDMRSLFVNWNGGTWNQGNAALADNGNNPLVTNLTMSGCVTAVSCNWDMSWQSTILNGPLQGVRGTWALSGTIAAVPEASTYSMMLVGMALVGGAARRRIKKGKSD